MKMEIQPVEEMRLELLAWAIGIMDGCADIPTTIGMAQAFEAYVFTGMNILVDTPQDKAA